MYLSTKNLLLIEKLYSTLQFYSKSVKRPDGTVVGKRIEFTDYNNLIEELEDMISSIRENKKLSNAKTAKYIAEKRKDNKDYGRGEKYLKERDRKRQEKNRKKAEAVFEKFRGIRPRDRKPEEKLAKVRALFPSKGV